MQEFNPLYPATTAATSVTLPILLNDAASVYVQWKLSGSDVAGTASVETSADNSNWVTYGSTTSVTSSAAGYYNLDGIAAKYVRFKWAYTSGTGNLTVWANVKNKTVSQVVAR